MFVKLCELPPKRPTWQGETPSSLRATSAAASLIPGSTESRPTRIARVRLTNRAVRPIDENPRGTPDLLRDLRRGRNEFRREPWIEADQIMGHQNLPITMFARADSDRRDFDRARDLARRFRGDVKGEIDLVIGPAADEDHDRDVGFAVDALRHLVQSGARPRAAASVVAALTGTRANDLYRALTGREPRK